VQAPVEAFYLPAGSGRSGQRLGVLHRARGTPRGAVLHLHAFAEEMNKSRRMVALQARALAEAGFDVLLLDLLGCGDSSGDFGDATWDDWLADARLGADWLLQQHPAGPLWLWGLRAGALLAVQTACSITAQTPCHLLLWQPPPNGKLLLQQFVRLKAARDLLSGEGKGVTEAVRRELAAGKAVEIAGYLLSPALAAGLEGAVPTPPRQPGRVCWFEVGAGGAPSPAAGLAAERWRSAGWSVELQAVAGSAFWQTTEIETAPALLEATVNALSRQPVELAAA
jgi:exosortase A-associated hydrolase 2